MLASPRWSAVPRRGLLLALTGAVAFLLSACSISIQEHEVAQRDVIGDLVVTTKLCDTTANTSPADPCDRGSYDASPAGVQHFLAYLASDWLIAPKTVGFKGDPGDVQLTRSPQIEAVMHARHAAPAGLTWVGYESGVLPRQQAGVPNRVTATAVFGVASGKLRQEAVVEAANSYRWASATDAQYAVDRPVNCWTGSGPAGLGVSADAECLYSHTWSVATDPATGATTAQYDAAVKLSGAAFTAPAPQQAQQAQVATLEFSTESIAADPGSPGKLELSAVSSLPGATLEWPSELVLGSSAALPVKVAVPADAKPGDYTVTLGDAKGLRSATAKLTVTAAPRAQDQQPLSAPVPSPVPSPAPSPGPSPLIAGDLIQTSQWLAATLGSDRGIRGMLAKGRGFTATPNLPGAGFLRISLVQRPKQATDAKRPPVLFVGTGPTDQPGPKPMGVKPTKKGGPLLRKAKSFNGYIVLRFWDRSGKTVSTPLKLKLK